LTPQRGQAPTAQRLVNGEQPGDDEDQSQPQHIIHDDDAGDEAQRPSDAARNAAVRLRLGRKNWLTPENLPQRFSVASRAKVRQIGGMDFSNSQFVGGGALERIGGGYLVYGWRQKSSIPLVGGV